MLGTEEIIKRLQPVLGKRADAIWQSYLASDEEERKITRHTLENLYSQTVDDFKQEKIILIPPNQFEELYGDYPLGMVWYAIVLKPL